LSFDSCKKPEQQQACFSYSPLTIVIGLTDTFYNCTNNAASSKWYFGDGDSDITHFNSTHTYTSPGNYTVKLISTDSGGHVSTTTQGLTADISAITSGNFTGTFSGAQACSATGNSNSSITITADSYLGVYITNLYGSSTTFKGSINVQNGTITIIPELFTAGSITSELTGTLSPSPGFDTIYTMLTITSFGSNNYCSATLVK